MADDFERYVDEEVAQLCEDWELWNDQQCEFDGE
jgi:hypothetical protein